jgi:hypothetical protein
MSPLISYHSSSLSGREHVRFRRRLPLRGSLREQQKKPPNHRVHELQHHCFGGSVPPRQTRHNSLDKRSKCDIESSSHSSSETGSIRTSFWTCTNQSAAALVYGDHNHCRPPTVEGLAERITSRMVGHDERRGERTKVATLLPRDRRACSLVGWVIEVSA